MWSTFHAPEQIPNYIPELGAQDQEIFVIFKNVLLAHGRVYQMYKNEFKEQQKGVCIM